MKFCFEFVNQQVNNDKGSQIVSLKKLYETEYKWQEKSNV